MGSSMSTQLDKLKHILKHLTQHHEHQSPARSQLSQLESCPIMNIIEHHRLIERVDRDADTPTVQLPAELRGSDFETAHAAAETSCRAA